MRHLCELVQFQLFFSRGRGRSGKPGSNSRAGRGRRRVGRSGNKAGVVALCVATPRCCEPCAATFEVRRAVCEVSASVAQRTGACTKIELELWIRDFRSCTGQRVHLARDSLRKDSLGLGATLRRCFRGPWGQGQVIHVDVHLHVCWRCFRLVWDLVFSSCL